jgi:GAF domain-containing protein
MGPKGKIAERHKLLLRVIEVALTNSTPEGVFQGTCKALKSIVPYDRASISIYDPDQDGLKIVDAVGPHLTGIFRSGHVIDRKTTQTGWVFDHQTRMFRRDLANELRFPGDKYVLDEGYQCLCSVPLVLYGTSIGVLTVLAARKNQLSFNHADVVEEVSKPIALAIGCTLPRCPSHRNTKMVCPRCIGAAGGKTTVSKHRDDLSSWGKKGGRGRKHVDQG